MHLSGMVPRNDAPLPNPVQLNHAQLPQFVPQQGHQPGLQPGGLPPPANQLPLDPMFDFLTEPLAEGLNPIQVQFDPVKGQCQKIFYRSP